MPDPKKRKLEDTQSIEKQVTAAIEHFNAGRVSDAWRKIAPFTDELPSEPQLRKQVQYLTLGCALYRVGDVTKANQLNRSLPTDIWRPLRYRLAFRSRDALQCKRIRSDPGVSKREKHDFACSAGLRLIWNRRYKSGLQLYRHRVHAILFPHILPDGLVYAELPDDPKEDLENITIEQGVGDVVLQLAHVQAFAGKSKPRFFGIEKYRRMVGRYFPGSEFCDANNLGQKWKGVKTHFAADFLARGFARNNSFNCGKQLDKPLKDGPEVYGICWRGGSGQNRREERHIPLHFFLDLLPQDGRYLALQFDLTDAEREILQRDPRCQVPLLDLTEDPLVTMDLIRPLAGVISVDSANWHFAGQSDVPIFGIMNKTAHWFWGKTEEVGEVYPNSITVKKEAMRPERIAKWQSNAAKLYSRRERPETPALNKGDYLNRPVFMTGLPRSRSSMLAGILAQSGLWMGDTIGPSADNPKGFFENRDIRERYVKGILRHLGVDPLGVTSLPDIDFLPPYPHLASQLAQRLQKQGYGGRGPWGYKDPKLSLIWPIFAKSFPHAQWVIITRNREAVLASCQKSSFFAKHSASAEYWSMFHLAYQRRLDLLRQAQPQLIEIDTDRIIGGDLSVLHQLAEVLGLDINTDQAQGFITKAPG